VPDLAVHENQHIEVEYLPQHQGTLKVMQQVRKTISISESRAMETTVL